MQDIQEVLNTGLVKIHKSNLPSGWSFPVESSDLVCSDLQQLMLDLKTDIRYDRLEGHRNFSIWRDLLWVYYLKPTRTEDARLQFLINPILSQYRHDTRKLMQESVIPYLASWVQEKVNAPLQNSHHCLIRYNYWHKDLRYSQPKTGWVELKEDDAETIRQTWPHLMEQVNA